MSHFSNWDKHSIQIMKWFKKKYDKQFINITIRMDENFSDKDKARLFDALTNEKWYGFFMGKSIVV